MQKVDFRDDDGKFLSGPRQSLGGADFWDDDATARGAQQQEGGHWVTIDAQEQRQTLIRAQDKAIGNPEFVPHGHTTYCNQATCAVAKALGGPMGPFVDAQGVPLRADQIGANLAKTGSGYTQSSAEQAQQLANQGKLVIVAGPGHVATVRPDTGQPVAGHGPIIANVGKANGVKRLSYVFTQRAMPEVKFYTPNEYLQVTPAGFLAGEITGPAKEASSVCLRSMLPHEEGCFGRRAPSA